MFALPNKIITLPLFIACLFLPSLAHADAVLECLREQDPTLAANMANRLLQGGNLSHSDELFALSCLGGAYSKMGRFQDALPVFQRMEAQSETTAELEYAYSLQGRMYEELNNLDRAEKFYQLYVEAVRKVGTESGIADALRTLAKLVNKRGDQERALEYYGEALAKLPASSEKITRRKVLQEMALIHASRKEFKQAISLLRQAVEIALPGEPYSAAEHQIVLADILQQAKQYPSARKELLSALDTKRKLAPTGVPDICARLVLLANDQNNPKRNIAEARQCYKQAEVELRKQGYTTEADKLVELQAGK